MFLMAKRGIAARLLLLVPLGAAILSVAWVAEDAYITFRTVDNFLDGIGLRWNPDERVQAYTHPLWMFLLAASGLVTRNWFLSSIAAGVACTLAAGAVIALCAARSGWHAVLVISILTGSAAFRDFSTSGLENPLAHLLLAVFLFPALSRERPPMLTLALLFSAICLNRLDHAVLAGPVLAWCFHRAPDARALIAGLIPFAAWEAFSIYYYGVPFPNTAYAKLSTGIDSSVLVRQGVLYLRNSFLWDPLTLIAIEAGALAAIFSRRGTERAVAFGMAAYGIYLIRIGGDFMSGRFLTAPLIAAVVLLARMDFRWLGRTTWGICFAAAGALGLAGLRHHPDFDEAGVASERHVYHAVSLAEYRESPDFPVHQYHENAKAELRRGERVVFNQNIGIMGYKMGRRAHIVDPLALSDPLLARLPMQPQPWRVGHYMRAVPIGYRETLLSGGNQIADPGLARLWDDLALLTRAPLDAPARWAAIWRVNSGAHEKAVRDWATPATAVHGDPAIRALADHRGIEIALPTRTASAVEVECEANDFYFVMFLRAGKPLAGIDIPPARDPTAQMRTERVIPPVQAAGGFDSIRVHPRWGDWSYRTGRIQVVP